MKRKDFGELVAALRQDLGWTQSQLAEAADIDDAVVSQMERGVKKYFEPHLLFQLANAFQFTTLERHEFLLAASGLDQKEMVRQPSAATLTDAFNVEKTLEKMVELTGQVRLPAFLWDVYGDVVAANNIITSFFRVPPEYVEMASQIPGGYNMCRFSFGKDLLARNQVIENWDQFALNAMRAFRENSLRYRAQPYFKYLMKLFRNQNEYPLFDRYWKLVSSIEQDKEVNTDHYAYHHRDFGDIKYISSSFASITSFGELFLVHYLPLDERTSQIFEQLAQHAGQGATTFAPWPEKTYPR
jgi:transcriptional regulator with XRE-family HTH domain